MTLKENASFTACLILTLIVGLLLTAGNIVFGPLNHDEGWYIYSALQVAGGHFPFIDFAFTQPPLFPLFYSLAHPVFEAYGMLGARIVTAVLGWLSALVWASLAARLTPRSCCRWAFLLTLILVLLNSYHNYFTVIPKTYALTLLLLGLFALSLERALHSKRWQWALAAGLLAGACFCSRISCVPVLLVPPIVFLLRDQGVKSSQLWMFAAGGTISVLYLLGPFFIEAPGNTWFGLVVYHGLRDPGTVAQLLLFKVGFLARVAQGYSLLIFLTLLVLGLNLFRQTHPPAYESEKLFLTALGSIILLISLIQFFAPFPYDDYQVVIMPALAVWVVATLLGRILSEHRRRIFAPLFTWCIWIFSLVLTAASPIHQDWMISGRDRIWWKVKENPDLIELQNTAALFPEEARGATLLTQDLYLAVEAGMTVPEGLEMGPFAFYPSWTKEQAVQRHVMNTDRLLESIEGRNADWAAISGYAFSIESPDIRRVDDETYATLMLALETHYEPFHHVPDFGQGATELILYRVKPEAAE